MVADVNWHSRAACAGYDPDLFFPRSYSEVNTRRPLGICRACPVLSDCRADALEDWQEYGIVGGTTPAERRRIARDNGTYSTRTKRPAPAPGTAGHAMRHRRAGEQLCDACKTWDAAKNRAYKERRRELRAQARLAS